MRHLLKLPLFLFVIFIVVACSSKKAETENPYIEPSVSAPAPADASVLPPSTGEARVQRERPRIALVIGGAGVASYASIGIFKKFKEAGIQIDLIVSSGSATLFALGYGFLKSIHDLEWFALRLQNNDWKKLSQFDLNERDAIRESLPKHVEDKFGHKVIEESKIPIIVSLPSTRNPEIYERGEWKTPLLRSLSIPGLYRDLTDSDGDWGLHSLDVSEALRRDSKFVVSISMYDDYFETLKNDPKNQLLHAPMKSYLRKQIEQSHLHGNIFLGKPANDLRVRLEAIRKGSQEASRLIKEMRALEH